MWSRSETALGVEVGRGANQASPRSNLPKSFLPAVSHCSWGYGPLHWDPPSSAFIACQVEPNSITHCGLNGLGKALPPPLGMPSPWSRLRPPPVALLIMAAQVRHPFSAALSGPSTSPPHAPVHGLVWLACSDIVLPPTGWELLEGRAFQGHKLCTGNSDQDPAWEMFASSAGFEFLNLPSHGQRRNASGI